MVFLKMGLLIRAQNISRYGKYMLFSILLVMVLGFVLMNGDKIRGMWNTGNINPLLSTEEFTTSPLDEDTVTCLRKLNREDIVKGFESVHTIHGKPIWRFSRLFASLNIKIAAIEPSFLYCLLRPTHQQLLYKRKFNISNFLGSQYTATFGITGKDASRLVQEETIEIFRKAGFLPYFYYSEIPGWMQINEPSTKEQIISHIFYIYYYWTFHLVVFYERNDYFWQAAFSSKEKQGIPQKNKLLFVEHNSAFDNFTFIALSTKSHLISKFYIPSNPHFFLFQILSSRFLECDPSNLKIGNDSSVMPTSHGRLSVDEFNTRMIKAMAELKTLFNSLLMNFWIFSGTMLGWYRECDVIPYTSDVDFGAWAADVDDLDFLINFFKNNKKLQITQRMGILKRALEFRLYCDNLWIDIFFMYQIHNGSWASGHRPSRGYFFKYYYPPFTLCSAELLDMKVTVPCETENVIKAEYGPNWRKPVSSWYYESSIFNRGPNYYWAPEIRNDTYQEY